MNHNEIELEIAEAVTQLDGMHAIHPPSEPPGLPTFNKRYLMARASSFKPTSVRTLLYLNDLLKKAQHCLNTGNPSTADLFYEQLQQAVSGPLDANVQKYTDALILPIIATFKNSRHTNSEETEELFNQSISASESLYRENHDILLLEHIVQLEIVRARLLIRKSKVEYAISAMIRRMEFVHDERSGNTIQEDIDPMIIKLYLELFSYSLLSPAFREQLGELRERFEFVADDDASSKRFLPAFSLMQLALAKRNLKDALTAFSQAIRLLGSRDELSLLATAFPELMEQLDNYPALRELLRNRFRTYAEMKLPKYMRKAVFVEEKDVMQETN